MTSLDQLLEQLVSYINALPFEEQVTALNTCRQRLHEASPFRHEPVDLVLWVKGEQVHANAYNPNRVAPPELKLLATSIQADGYTQPIVGHAQEDQIEVVDGFHRQRVGKEDAQIRDRVHGYLPVVVIESTRADLSDRMAATIRHNRARGKHIVELDTNIVLDLVRRGKSDAWIAENLGMDVDEVTRRKQTTGLAEMFKDRKFSQAWEVTDDEDAG
jgi:ParB-like chromosome segregation protein Spo0J